MAGENAAPPKRMCGPAHLVVPALARPGGHYSHAAVGGGVVFIAGQLPITPGGEHLVHAGFAEQVAQTLANVRAALLAAGSGIDKLLQLRVYLDDIANWPAFDTIYERWAGPSRPARAVVPTGPLHFGFKVEVEATALL
jgi:enamine deaminase RidA (YjgF/YER057c/UK114 family)